MLMIKAKYVDVDMRLWIDLRLDSGVASGVVLVSYAFFYSL